MERGREGVKRQSLILLLDIASMSTLQITPLHSASILFYLSAFPLITPKVYIHDLEERYLPFDGFSLLDSSLLHTADHVSG